MENTSKIRIGIIGYGNLGKGAELAIQQNSDMELVAVFTRRNPETIHSSAKVASVNDIESYIEKIDVMLLCGGSAKDLPKQVIEFSRHFHTVDSFDNHGKIPEYFEAVNTNTLKHGTLSLISSGWDPGLFSMARLLEECVLPDGKTYTFWGKGLSQGHSDAIRKVKGVKNGVQYTIPSEDALEKVRSGKQPDLGVADKHKRICYVVLEDGADRTEVETAIKTMPNYFEPYDTTVHFISEEKLNKDHTDMPHGGIVLRSGKSKNNFNQRIEFSLALDSNPDFTSSVLVAYARAVHKLAKDGKRGAITVFDVPLGYLSPKSPEELRRSLL